MLKKTFGRKLGRNKNQRRALFRGLYTSLIDNGEIITSLAKAKAIRSEMEKLITKAKRATLADRRMIFRQLGRRDLVNRLVESIGTVFKDRPGGYLRIVRLAKRRGDLADMVKVMLTETPLEKSAQKPQPPQPLQLPQTPQKVAKKVNKKTKND